MTKEDLRKEVGRLELKVMYAKELKANTEVFEAWRVRHVINMVVDILDKLESKEEK